ncbi:MAG: putative MFS-type transporter YhjX [Pseudomonadota bacterium]|jgi:MFS family permease
MDAHRPARPDYSDEPAYGWVVVWATFTALAVIFGVAYSFAAFFESFAAEFRANRAQVSLVFGLSGLLYFVLGAGGGMLADRHGPARVTSVGMVCIALGLLAASLAGSMEQVMWGYGLGVGAGIALVYTPAIGSVPPWFVRRRGFASGIASAGIGAGTLVMPLVATWAVSAFGWRGALQAIAFGVVLLGLAATLLLRRAPRARAAAGQPPAGYTLGEAVRSRSFAWIYLGGLLAGPSQMVPFAHVSAAARDAGIADAQAVGLVGLIGVGSLVGRFSVGALADRLGRPVTLVVAQAALGASFLVWALAGGHYLAFAAFALCVGLSYGGIVSLLPALMMDLYGARAVSSIIGALYTSAACGVLIGPWVAGRLFDGTGSYGTVIAMCAALSAGAAASTWMGVRPRPVQRA